LKREGWEVNAKRIYRLYTEKGLIVRTQKRRERAERQRIAQGQALTVVDQFTRECLVLHADTALSGEKAAMALSEIVGLRGAPQSITVDNGTEF
jgi:putative transposase